MDREDPPAPPVVTVEEPLPAPALRLDLGLGSPVGMIGLVYTRPLASWYGVELGGGLGASGLTVSAMGKLRLGGEHWKFTPGLGLSFGLPMGGDQPTFHEGHPNGDDETRGRAVKMGWFDIDVLGVEYRTGGGFVMAASGGVSVALTRAHWDLGDMGSDIGPGDPVPQLRVGMGWTF